MTVAAITALPPALGARFNGAASAATAVASGTNGTSGTTGTNGTTGAAAPTVGSSTLDREAFLKLLVAQLKYQDPSKPADATQMISQSAQLSVVDKLSEISTAIVASGTTNRLTLGASIIGRSVTFQGPNQTTLTQTVTAVRFTGTEMILRAGSWDVPLGAVLSFESGSAPTAPSTTTPTTTPSTTTPSTTTPTTTTPAAA